MSKPESDRNLLVGILALQLSLVNEQQLLTAVKAWAFDKTRFLEDLFFEHKAIDEQSRSMLRVLLERNNTLHADVSARQTADPDLRSRRESLPTVMAVMRKLSDIDDAEIRDSVADFLKDGEGADEGGRAEQPTQPSAKAERGRRFRIVTRVAEGGLGRVSLAEDLELHREVALKEIRPKYLKSEETRARFLLEAEVTGRLEHPGIVPVYSLGSSSEAGPFYAMQFIRGVSLAEAIRKLHSERSKLDPNTMRLEIRKLIGRLVTASQAVHYAHTKGVLHRDIKPQNIMLGKFGETFVVDWGLARVNKTDSRIPEVDTDESILVPSGSGSSATQLGAMVGTIEYMSPEQADGRLEDMGPTADVFSLGATLYCILTGSYPVSSTIKKERSRLDYGRFLSPSQINRELPPALDAICLKALATETSDRYQSAAELVDELEAWMADEPVAAYPEPLGDRARRWLKRHRAWAASGAAVVATSLIALSGLLVVLSNHNRDLTKARDEAVQNETVARSLLSTELRIDQELLGRNELTAKEIAELRLRLAEGTYEQYKAWYERNPQDRQMRTEFAFAARALSNLHRSISNFPAAQSYIQASLKAQEAVPLDEKTIEEENDFVLSARDATELEFLDGRLGNALILSDKALNVLQSSSADSALEGSHASTLGDVRVLRATILRELGNYDKALTEVQQAEATLRALPTNTNNETQLGALRLQSTLLHARILSESGRSSQSLLLADEAISEMRPMVQTSKREFQNAFIDILNLAAQIRISQMIEIDRASTLLSEASQLLEEQFAREKTAKFSLSYSDTERLHSSLLRQQGKLEEARRSASLANSEAGALVARLPLVESLLAQAETEVELFELARVLGDAEKANQSLDAAQVSLLKAMQKSPSSARVRARLKNVEDLKNK